MSFTACGEPCIDPTPITHARLLHPWLPNRKFGSVRCIGLRRLVHADTAPVTGCGSGFGRSMAQYALAQGDKVVATVRTGSATALDGLRAAHPGALLVVHLDVAHAKEIPRAFEQAQAAFGRVDVVFNNAGVSLVGEVEGTPEDAARKTFDVNFWGAVNVSREAVRFFREENERGVGGRLLVNSSFAGICPIACGGFYSSTKFGKRHTQRSVFAAG